VTVPPLTSTREALHHGFDYFGHELDDVTGRVHAFSTEAKLYERSLTELEAAEQWMADAALVIEAIDICLAQPPARTAQSLEIGRLREALAAFDAAHPTKEEGT
jgi:hypothetical protein